MPPPSAVLAAAGLWRRSKELANVQKLVRRTFSQAFATAISSMDTSASSYAAQTALRVQQLSVRPIHAARSRCSSDSSSSQSHDPVHSIAQSLEQRLKLLQEEHTDSQVLHQSSSAKPQPLHQPNLGAAAHSLLENTDREKVEEQWARYLDHRVVAQQYTAQKQLQKQLHWREASKASSMSNNDDDDDWAASPEDDVVSEGKLHQLRAILDSPIGSVPVYIGSNEEEEDYDEDDADLDDETERESTRSNHLAAAEERTQTTFTTSNKNHVLQKGGSALSQTEEAEERAQQAPSRPQRQKELQRGRSASSRTEAAAGTPQQARSTSRHDQLLLETNSQSSAVPASYDTWGSLDKMAGYLGLPGAAHAETVPIHSQQLLQAGIIGVPNSGKSTLTNALVGQKVTAVSAKTNTTATSRLGAFTEGNCQVALYDTPGVVHTRFLHGPRHAKSVRSAWGTAGNCELLMCIVDAHRQIVKPDIRVYNLVEELASGPLPSWNPVPTVLVLNKVDLLSKEQGQPLLHLRDRFLQLFPFQDIFCISSRHGAGVPELKQYLLDKCEPGKWIVRSWETTDMGPSEIATEIVREKLFKRLYKEIPYTLDIVDTAVDFHRDGSIRIEKHIIVTNQQVRAMVVGAKGAVIGEIGIGARKDLEAVLNKKIHLILEVKVSAR